MASAIAWLALLAFAAAILLRFLRLQRYPLHLRWELYPVPGEGGRAAHGGSRQEEVDWWTKPRKLDRMRELSAMLAEMVLMKGLFVHNRRLWYRSFPFHFGLYLSAGFGKLLALQALLLLLGARPLPWLLGLTALLGLLGLPLAVGGALALLVLRATDPELRPWTRPAHFFNLGAIALVLGLLGAAWAWEGLAAGPLAVELAGLIAWRPGAFPVPRAALVATTLLLAYIPLTHMSHFFVKWFTWHRIRWDDEPNVRGGRIEELVRRSLEAPSSWSAEHMRPAEGRRWVDLAGKERTAP